VFDAIAGLLAFFYELVPDYGVAIFLLTIVVMVVLTPFTMKGTRSMMAMQRLQPEMKKLQERYKGDREKLNEEMMAFYKENQINPLSGCLPLFIQLPVFLILFRVIQGLTLKVSIEGANLGWTAGHAIAGSSAPDLPSLTRTFDPGYIDHSTQLYKDLSVVTQMKGFGIDLAESVTQALSSGIAHAAPYLLLVAAVGATSWYQQQQISARNDARGVDADANMKMMTKVMPLMLPIFAIGMPSGLVVYFLVSNVYRVGQQGWITRTMAHGGQAKGGVAIETTATESEEPEKKALEKKEPGGKTSSDKASKDKVSKGKVSKGKVSKDKVSNDKASKSKGFRKKASKSKADDDEPPKPRPSKRTGGGDQRPGGGGKKRKK